MSRLPASQPMADTRPGETAAVPPPTGLIARAGRGHASRGTWTQKWLAIIGVLLVFGALNASVLQKERVLREGQVVRLSLAPVDPRAFMTGDFMALNYAIANELNRTMVSDKDRARDAVVVVSLDGQGIGKLVRLQERASPLQAGEVALKLRVRDGRVRLGTDAFYFPEGTARRYEKARYGEFRVAPDGEMLLVRLLDVSLAQVQDVQEAQAD